VARSPLRADRVPLWPSLPAATAAPVRAPTIRLLDIKRTL